MNYDACVFKFPYDTDARVRANRAVKRPNQDNLSICEQLGYRLTYYASYCHSINK